MENQKELEMTKPKVILFNGVSLDGKLDNSVDTGLYYGLAGSWNADAMLSGSGTMLAAFAAQADVPAETADGPKQTLPDAVPYLVIIDSRGRIHNWQQIQAQPYWRQTVALCSQATPRAAMDEIEKAGVPCIVCGADRVDLGAALEELNARFGIVTVRVDSGGSLNGALLQAEVVNEVSVLVGASLVGRGGASGLAAEAFFGTENSPANPIPLKLVHCETVGENAVWLRYTVSGA
jgi:2,5-diamino-6-(ribosylamino)-4(3H)-pyrimidinone 5'-phosphate reductase